MKVIICGAGIAGLSLACWLQRDGWQVEIVEHAPGPRRAGYMIDFFGPGYDVAELMGLLPRLRQAHTTIEELAYVNPDERGEGHLGYRRFAQFLDGRLVSLMRGDLERILLQALGERVTIRYGTTVGAVAERAGGVQVSLSDGRAERAEVLVGADGTHSRVRELVFGPQQRFLRPLGYHTASYLFADDDVRARVGNRFLLVGVPGRQAGLYPTNDGQLAASLIHATQEDLPADPHATVRAVYGALGGLVRRALRHCPDGPDLFYDQVAQVQMTGWSRGPVILLGDACQAVSLMAGQGASLAVGAGYVLAEELTRGDTAAAAAARYEQRLAPLVRDKQRAGRTTARWMVPGRQWRITARRLALAAARLPGTTRLARTALASLRISVVTSDRRQLAGTA